jgi:cytochrome c556
MRRTFTLSLLAAAVLFGLNVLANEKPTPEFQELMKSNAAAAGPTGLRGHVPAKDYDAIAKDAATLKANYTKIEAFWTQKKVEDAIKLAKDGGKAAADLELAAKAKDDAGITAAMGKVTATCSGCHTAHRVQLPDKTYEIKY